MGTWHPDIRDAVRVSTLSVGKMPVAPRPVHVLWGAQPLGFGAGGSGMDTLGVWSPTVPWGLSPQDLVQASGIHLEWGLLTVPSVLSPQDLVQGVRD